MLDFREMTVNQGFLVLVHTELAWSLMKTDDRQAFTTKVERAVLGEMEDMEEELSPAHVYMCVCVCVCVGQEGFSNPERCVNVIEMRG